VRSCQKKKKNVSGVAMMFAIGCECCCDDGSAIGCDHCCDDVCVIWIGCL